MAAAEKAAEAVRLRAESAEAAEAVAAAAVKVEAAARAAAEAGAAAAREERLVERRLMLDELHEGRASITYGYRLSHVWLQGGAACRARFPSTHDCRLRHVGLQAPSHTVAGAPRSDLRRGRRSGRGR
eukprot:scaffold97471_cov27-Phaeocystis_antarctica.AAC.1